MKSHLGAWCVLAVCLAGCTQTGSRPAARLQGTYSLALAGELLFVASAERNELRVLDLAASPMDFVRAPNPLEPLSIPVVSHAEALSRDRGWVRGEDGRWAEVGPRYVYAWSPGGSEVSLVGAGRDAGLKELRRLRLGQPVTALAARPEGDGSVLFAATWEGGAAGGARATVWRVPVPAPGLVADAPLLPSPVRTFEGQRVEALAVLPGDEALVVGLGSSDGGGDVVTFAVAAPTTLRSLRFPSAEVQVREDCERLAQDRAADVGGRRTRGDCGFGAPVRALEVQADVGGAPDAVRIFGLLDESSCTAQPWCVGIEAVELAGEAARIARESFTGLPMLPVRPSTGIVTAFSLAPDASVFVPSLGARVNYAPLGLAVSGAGELLFWDAEALRMIDDDAAGPTASLSSARADGGVLDGGVDPSSVVLGSGAARTERVAVIFGGPLTGSLPAPADGASLTLDVDAEGVLPGDEVIWTGGAEGCVPSTVASSSGRQITLSAAADPACAGRTGFYVRAGPSTAQPFSVVGAQTGRMGRMAAGATFVFPAAGQTDEETARRREARYFFHGLDAFGGLDGGVYVPSGLPAPQLAFSLPAAEESLGVGDAYLVTISANVAPLSFVIPPQSYASNAWVPTAVVRAPATDRVYVAYPAANAVLELDPDTLAGARTWVVTGTYQ
jgi:hypothetical protein